MTKRSRKASPVIGTWLITESELWDLDYLELDDQPIITFNRGKAGEIRFGAFHSTIDWRVTDTREGRVEFTFDGFDEGDHVFGRGVVSVDEGGALRGRIYFHLGGDSGFVAERKRSR